MTYKHWLGIAGLTALCLPAAAGADWRFTKWAMPLDEVVRGGKSLQVGEIEDDPDERLGSLQRLAQGESTEAGIEVRVYFYFSARAKQLQLIRFAPKTKISCFDIEKALVAEHGQGKAKSSEQELDDGRGGKVHFTMQQRKWGGGSKDLIGFEHAMSGKTSLDVCPWYVKPAE